MRRPRSYNGRLAAMRHRRVRVGRRGIARGADCTRCALRRSRQRSRPSLTKPGKIEVKPINPFDTESTVMGQPIY